MGIEFTAPAGSEGSELLRALIEFLDHAAAAALSISAQFLHLNHQLISMYQAANARSPVLLMR